MENEQISKYLAASELLVPALMHYFDLSMVEVVINGRFIYDIKSDFSSILFYISMSMIFQAARKKKNVDVINMPLKIVGVVTENITCETYWVVN